MNAILLTSNSLQLPADDYRRMRLFLRAVAVLHHVEGDSLGAEARAWLAELPEPVSREYGGAAVTTARRSETAVGYEYKEDQ